MVTLGGRRLNAVFTRAVNHCFVLGIKAAYPAKSGGVSQKNRLAPKLNSEDERQIGQKTTLLQHLKAIRSNLPRECLRGGKRFC